MCSIQTCVRQSVETAVGLTGKGDTRAEPLRFARKAGHSWQFLHSPSASSAAVGLRFRWSITLSLRIGRDDQRRPGAARARSMPTDACLRGNRSSAQMLDSPQKRSYDLGLPLLDPAGQTCPSERYLQDGIFQTVLSRRFPAERRFGNVYV